MTQYALTVGTCWPLALWATYVDHVQAGQVTILLKTTKIKIACGNTEMVSMSFNTSYSILFQNSTTFWLILSWIVCASCQFRYKKNTVDLFCKVFVISACLIAEQDNNPYTPRLQNLYCFCCTTVIYSHLITKITKISERIHIYFHEVFNFMYIDGL